MRDGTGTNGTPGGAACGNGDLVDAAVSAQLAHFRKSDPPCRGVQLPDGVLLRYTQMASLYFYLKTVAENGVIRTQVYATDSPYDRQKAAIGAVGTPMFDPRADHAHLDKIEELMREWVEFVGKAADGDRDFQSFRFGERGN